MVGPRPALLSALLVALSWPASASLVEDASDGAVAYQFDADNHHDAPDACRDAAPGWSLPLDASVDGLIVPPDDLSDVFLLDVPADAVGSRVTLRLREGADATDLDVTAFLPGCLLDVLAPEAQPQAPPMPPAPASGERQVAVEATPKGACGPDWFFMVQGLVGAAPGAMHAAWTDGSEASVPLTHVSGHVAMYRTSANIANTLTGAWINLPATFTGSFEVAHAPCGIADGGAVYGPPNVAGDDVIAFTPVRAGPHAIQVRLAPPSLPGVPTAVPMSCHMCVDGGDEAAQKASYVLSSDQDDGAAKSSAMA